MGSATVLVCSAVLLAGALVQRGSAQQPGEVRIRSAPYQPPSATISVDTNLVELGVTVRDRKGTPVGGLQESDFQVLDNLKRQDIAFFSEQRMQQPGTAPTTAPPAAGAPTPPAAQTAHAAAPPPRYLALFFDDTHAGLAGFERTKRAAEKLLAEGLHPGDRAGIFTSSGAVTIDFTSDTKALLATLPGMRRHPDGASIKGLGVCPTLTAYQACVIAKHLDGMAKMVAVADIRACDPAIPEDIAEMQAQSAAESAWDQFRPQSADVLSTLLLVVRHLSAAPGTRILLMVSPGFVTDGLDRQIADITDACLRNHIVINALDDEGLLSGGLDSPESLGAHDGPRVAWAQRTVGLRTQIVTAFLADAAASTGGQFIHNNNDLTAGLQALAAVPEVSYLLGFSPPGKPDGKYHKLKVAAKPGYQVSTRPGYFASPPAKRTETAQQHIDRVVASGESLDQIPATVTVRAVADKEGRYRIRVDIMLDARRLPFSAQNGANVQQLTFVTVLEDAAGNYLQGRQAVMDMAVSGATRTRMEAEGIKAATSFVAARGSYQVREVIREAVQNRLTACNSPIEIR